MVIVYDDGRLRRRRVICDAYDCILSQSKQSMSSYALISVSLQAHLACYPLPIVVLPSGPADGLIQA